MRTENYQQIEERFVCGDTVLENAIVLRKVLINEELEHCIKMSLTEAQDLSAFDDVFHTGAKINMLCWASKSEHQ